MNIKEKSSLDAFAALGLRIHCCVSSYQRAVWYVLFDGEADAGGCELRTLIHIGHSDIHGDGHPLGLRACQLGYITRLNHKLYIFGLLII